MLKFLVIIFAIIILTNQASFVYGVEESQDGKLRTAKGRVTAVNWVAQTITLRFFIEGAFDELTLFVPDKIKIAKGNNTVSFANINIGDQVKADYYNTSPGPLKVISLAVVTR
ncbi:MAG: hypothetical protein A2166_04580 [Omnitrophica WOR_2 bacterium RBG_13_41_10]|nr:MAG: hypothetical protein A2166_04580 [Omnitrophica WOR_2 bacterium RBG_13_41_10]